ncbi:outer membrane beta-barrel protein [Pedobacter insulae]|uniref:Outer membrane receptor proteins, mostly Fe transport n=1 Tax=Pedobacter insulae TaxID=414048 RepID=A0A1I2YZF6_9SPHI|nr:outer membrane beta-barrel protein [Pedobacter insulae]SFH30586.1 Outer membrane receptor proteins, mostly Fe transport [Pedobacter insulae]
MMKKLLISTATALLLIASFSALAQQKIGSLKGKAIDEKTNKPVEFASFAVKNVKDSTVAAMGATTPEGVFIAKGLAYGRYKFYLAIIGYKPILKLFEVTAEKTNIDFGDLKMEEAAITLNSVLIKGDLLPMIIKKDTIEFNADAFKTQADASLEDALKTMPGMEVDQDGKITFNGRKIDRVLVDGKDFFGNDPKMATQNLPKEIISKIQVIEKKTDDAIFKGVDDGKREHILNVTLKDDKKKGYFGNIVAGKANGSLYDGSFSLNRFNNKRQISVISMGNNINKTSFSYNDLTDFLGGDVFGSGMVTGVMIDGSGNITIGFGGEDFSSGSAGGGGINDNKGIGINFNDEWGKNPKYPYKVSANYMGNRNYGIRESLSSRLNLLGAESYFNDRDNDATTTTMRHRLNMRFDIPIDSMNKIQFSPNFGFSGSDTQNASVFSSYTRGGQENINKGTSLTSNDSKSPGFGGKLLYNRRFLKKGRSFSLTANGNLSNSVLDGLNLSNITINNNGVPANTILNQLIDQAGDVNNYSLSAEYAEPLSKKINLSINYTYNKREDIIERIVYDYNLGTTRYDLINNTLSRELQNFNENNNVSLRFNYRPNNKFNFTLNSSQKFVALAGRNLIDDKSLSRNFVLLEPNFYLSYKINKVSSLTANANRYNGIPSISQLQPLTDNANPLQITTGNPNLRPSAENSLSVSYNWFNPTTSSSINFYINFSNSENRIINNSLLDPKTGIQTTFYDNISGPYNYSGRLSGSFKIKSLGLTVSPNVNYNAGKNVTFLNKEIVSSNTQAIGLGASLNYALGADLQFSNRINANLREVAYHYNNLATQNFTTIFNNLSLNAALPYNLRFGLTSNVVYNANVGLGANNNTIHTANVSMEKLFLKKSLSLKASVSDVFNNSRNSSRYASDTYILESVNLGMRRYFLMSLTYRIKKFGAKESNNSFRAISVF